MNQKFAFYNRTINSNILLFETLDQLITFLKKQNCLQPDYVFTTFDQLSVDCFLFNQTNIEDITNDFNQVIKSCEEFCLMFIDGNIYVKTKNQFKELVEQWGIENVNWSLPLKQIIPIVNEQTTNNSISKNFNYVITLFSNTKTIKK